MNKELSKALSDVDDARAVFAKNRSRINAAPEEVATLVAYVCSPLSSATNGAALRVDGGVVKACF